MAKCDVCGQHVSMPYNCRGCGGTFCSDHRMPENHGCAGLDEWDDPSGVFDSGFDDSVEGESKRGGILDTGPGGPLGYFRGNVAYTFLALMVLTFLAEFVVLVAAPDYFGTLFTLSTKHPLYIWTWVTSVFAHSPQGFGHIFANGLVLFFFGPLVERYVGSKRFAALFLVTGAAAGLAQVGLGLLLGSPTAVLGASGAIMAILGVLTVLNPGLKVYLYFVLPIPIWLLTLGYAALSLVGAFGPGSVLGGNVAHFAHLTGLVLGLAYGYHVKDRVRTTMSEFQLGGGGRRF